MTKIYVVWNVLTFLLVGCCDCFDVVIVVFWVVDQLSPYLEQRTDDFVMTLYRKVLEVSISKPNTLHCGDLIFN